MKKKLWVIGLVGLLLVGTRVYAYCVDCPRKESNQQTGYYHHYNDYYNNSANTNTNDNNNNNTGNGNNQTGNGNTQGSGNNSTTQVKPADTTKTSPKTGDNNMILLFAVLCAGSRVVGVSTLKARRKIR